MCLLARGTDWNQTDENPNYICICSSCSYICSCSSKTHKTKKKFETQADYLKFNLVPKAPAKKGFPTCKYDIFSNSLLKGNQGR